MKIAALYARVSTGRQEKEETIRSQIDEIEAKALADGNVVGKNLRFQDDGWSGELLARPALDELRDLVKSKAFDILYIYDLGRLSRTFLNQLILIDEVKNAGIQLMSLHDINAETEEQVFAQRIMGLFHDYERVKIGERMRRGKLFKSKNGILFGWNAPYGYRYVKGEGANGGRFEILEDEAKVVRMIFDWLGNEGLTIRQVIKRLYQHKAPARQNKEGIWNTSTLSRRLRDTTYIGTHYYNKSVSIIPVKPLKVQKYKKIKKTSRRNKPHEEWHAIQVPSIIENDLFEATQAQLKRNSLFSKRNKKHDYLLSGLIRCTCGCTRAGEGGNQAGQYYYRCTDRIRRYPLPKVCDTPGVNESVIDREVWAQITLLLTSPSLVQEQADRWIQAQTKKSIIEPTDLETLKRQLEKLTNQEKRYLKAYGEGIISFEQYKEQVNTLKLDKSQIMSKLQDARDSSLPVSFTPLLPNLSQLCSKIANTLEGLSPDKKQWIVRQVLERVTTDGKTAVIRGFIPLSVAELQEKKYEQSSINRDSRITQCRQVYSL